MKGDITERLDKLREKFQNADFLQGHGLANEVNINIFCYDPKDEMVVRHFVSQALSDASLASKCNLKECNLYRIFLSICDDFAITAGAPDVEIKRGREHMLKVLQRAANNKSFVAKMQYPDHKLGDVLLLTGVGEVYPYMRMHSLLEAIQPEFSDIPVVVMYPGKFDGRSLKLFDKLIPNSYYRAFNII